MKYGLSLSGGGFKGMLQVGAVEELLNKIPQGFDIASGISTGALNAALIQGNQIQLLKDLWKSVKDSEGGVITNPKLAKIEDGKLKIDFAKVVKELTQGISFWEKAGVLFKSGRNNIAEEGLANLANIDSLLDNSPLFNLLKEHVNLDNYQDRLYKFGTTSLYTGEGNILSNKNFYSNEEFAKGILASSTMPVIWPSVPTIRTNRGTIRDVVDGGLRTISPIGIIFDEIKDGEEWTIFIVNCHSQMMEVDQRPKNMLNAGGRSLDILLNSTFVRDIKETTFRNSIVKEGNKQAKLIIIEPAVGDSGDTLDATPSMIEYRLALGRTLALKALQENGY